MVDFKTENLTFAYPGSKTAAISTIDLEINTGQFVVLCGKSGCGKTTLLKLLKPELSPHGKKSGSIKLFGKALSDITKRESAADIGFIMQNIEFQLVTHTVRSELAFGLENLGLSKETIQLRLAETASYFSLSKILDKKISELSGGQKQLVCLAAALAMHPKALILDEPTSQLDPATAEAFIDFLYKLCKENALTVIISEHRLEKLIALADRVIVMDEGKIICNDLPLKIGKELFSSNDFIKSAMPVSMRIHAALRLTGDAPMTVSDGRRMIEAVFGDCRIKNERTFSPPISDRETVMEMKNVSYSYDGKNYVLYKMDLSVKKGTFFALLGENASGKTTALKLMSALVRPTHGTVKLFGKKAGKYSYDELYTDFVSVLPQKCETLFAGSTVSEDMASVLQGKKISTEEKNRSISQALDFFEISDIKDRHPYDLSGGELQRAAFAMVLLKRPRILFLDEPTKGMDNLMKSRIGEKLKALCESGMTIIMVSHDAEFCASYCDECAMMFDARCISRKNAHDFFADNYFYTTAANKIARGVFPQAVTESEVLSLCRENLHS